MHTMQLTNPTWAKAMMNLYTPLAERPFTMGDDEYTAFVVERNMRFGRTGAAAQLVAEPLDRRWLERARRSSSAEPMWEPAYRQAPLSPATLERLLKHPQMLEAARASFPGR